jgi:hypothetical protein
VITRAVGLALGPPRDGPPRAMCGRLRGVVVGLASGFSQHLCLDERGWQDVLGRQFRSVTRGDGTTTNRALPTPIRAGTIAWDAQHRGPALGDSWALPSRSPSYCHHRSAADLRATTRTPAVCVVSGSSVNRDHRGSVRPSSLSGGRRRQRTRTSAVSPGPRRPIDIRRRPERRGRLCRIHDGQHHGNPLRRRAGSGLGWVLHGGHERDFTQ